MTGKAKAREADQHYCPSRGLGGYGDDLHLKGLIKRKRLNPVVEEEPVVRAKPSQIIARDAGPDEVMRQSPSDNGVTSTLTSIQ